MLAERVLLRRMHWLWPLVIVPYDRRPQTASLIGTRRGRPRVLKGVKAGLGPAQLVLTDLRLFAEYLLPWRIFVFEIPVGGIGATRVVPQDEWLLELHFTAIHRGRPLRFLASPSDPQQEGVILLNLGPDVSRWQQALTEIRARERTERGRGGL